MAVWALGGLALGACLCLQGWQGLWGALISAQRPEPQGKICSPCLARASRVTGHLHDLFCPDLIWAVCSRITFWRSVQRSCSIVCLLRLASIHMHVASARDAACYNTDLENE